MNSLLLCLNDDNFIMKIEGLICSVKNSLLYPVFQATVIL